MVVGEVMVGEEEEDMEMLQDVTVRIETEVVDNMDRNKA